MLSPRIALRGLEQLDGKIWESPEQLRVGRLSTCEIRFDSSRISRRHSEIVFSVDRWVVRDLGSTNGTFLNGVRLGSTDEVLHEGDILLFAELCVCVAEIVTPPTVAHQLDEKIAVLKSVADSTETAAGYFGGDSVEALEKNQAFESLLRVGRNLASHRSLENFLEAVLWESAEIINARFGAVLIKDHRGPSTVRAKISLGGANEFQVLLDQGLGEWAMNREGSLLCSIKTESSGSDSHGNARASTILAKLQTDDRMAGILCLVRSHEQPDFRESDLLLTDALARSLATSIDSYERFTQINQELTTQTLNALANLAFSRDANARARSRRVTQYALFIANRLSMLEADRQHLAIGTPLIDIGMFMLPPALLSKEGPLTPREKLQIRAHGVKGAEFLETIPALKFLTPLVRNHHEHWDGTGYPDGLKGAAIPLLARVVAVADAFEALTGPLPDGKHPTASLFEAFEEIQKGSETLYDPACVNALLQARKPIEELFVERGTMIVTLSREEVQETLEGFAPTTQTFRPVREKNQRASS